MRLVLSTVLYAALAIAIGWYAWRGVATGKILVSIRGGVPSWFVRREDPVSFWIVIALLALAAAGLMTMAVNFLL